ncbi:MAG: hypothetical protein AAGD05_09640, partial [Bacteroidota bacterium]
MPHDVHSIAAVSRTTALRQLGEFQMSFSTGHYALACQAALPVALTADLLYAIRNHFPQDLAGQSLEIPWIAVADVLLNLCQEVSPEMYQMEQHTRQLLLEELEMDVRFHISPSNSRLIELSQFLVAYIQPYLYSSNPYRRVFAESQYWAALVYLHPPQAATLMAQAMSTAQQNDNVLEQIRIKLLLDNFQSKNQELAKLQQYATANAASLHEKPEQVQAALSTLEFSAEGIEIADVVLPIPEYGAIPVEVNSIDSTNDPDSNTDSATTTAVQNVYVLLVGVNIYAQNVPPLAGTHNDVQLLQEYLQNNLQENVNLHTHLLLNEQATYSGSDGSYNL